MRFVLSILTLFLLNQSSNSRPQYDPPSSLNDLSTELKYSIMELLEFPVLVNLSMTGAEYRALSIDVVRRKYETLNINVHIKQRNRQPMKMTASGVDIFEYELAKTVLKNFGHLIRKLDIVDYFMKPYQLQTIGELVSEFCSASLSELTVRTLDKRLFMRPFNQLTDFSLGIFEESPTTIPPLNQSIPNIKKLSLDIKSDELIDLRFLECVLPYLEILHIDSSLIEIESHLEEFLCRNSHIKRIKLNNLTPNFLGVVNRCLPNLIELSTDKITSETELRFDHVERCELRNLRDALGTHLIFPRLDEIRIVHNGISTIQWENFFQRHSNVQRLWFDELSNGKRAIGDEFEMMLDELPHIRTVEAIFRTTAIGIDNVERIIETHSDLRVFQFQSMYWGERENLMIEQRFGRDWVVEVILDMYQGMKLTRR